MGRKLFLILIISYSSVTYGFFCGKPENYAKLIGSEYKDQKGLSKEIKMPPVKNQNEPGVAHCYAFAVSNILEKYNCDQKQLSDCDIKSEQQISPPFLTTLFHKIENTNKKFNQGGFGGFLLRDIQTFTEKKQKLPSYKCLPYERFQNKNKEFEKTWVEIKKLFHEINDPILKKYTPEIFCNRIYSIVPTLDFKYSSIIKILKATETRAIKNESDFIFQIYNNQQCNKEKIKIKKYKIRYFPLLEKSPSKSSYEKEIDMLIYNNVPLLASICTNNNYSCSGHQIVINGMKIVCNNKKCKKLYKIQNSYGEIWQKCHNDGWVEADNLLDYIMLKQKQVKRGNDDIPILSSIIKPTKIIKTNLVPSFNYTYQKNLVKKIKIRAMVKVKAKPKIVRSGYWKSSHGGLLYTCTSSGKKIYTDTEPKENCH